MKIPIARLALSILLIVSAVITSLSPLHARYAPAALGVVALGAALALILSGPKAAVPDPSYYLLTLALLSQLISATTQAIVSIRLPSPFLAINDTPGMAGFYLFLAGSASYLLVWLVCRRGVKGLIWGALLGAGLFSSTLYGRSFAVAEAGPVYGPIFALALLAGSFRFWADANEDPATGSDYKKDTGDRDRRRFPALIRPATRFILWSLIFLAAVLLSALLSPAPGPSLDYWLRLATLAGLAVVSSFCVRTNREWLFAACGIVAMAGGLPILLAVGKLASMAAFFGLPAALACRLHPTEMGGANLIARSVLDIVPLGLALLAISRSTLARTGSRHLSRLAPAVLLAGSAFIMLYSQSWEGFFAWLVALGVYALLVHWVEIRNFWWQWSGRRIILHWVARFGVALAVVAIFLGAVRLAPSLSIYSYNGRLIHWRGALLAWLDHPWVGGGPGNKTLYTSYAGQAPLVASSQITGDDPLNVNEVNAGIPLQFHSHNLFLEIGAGSGVVGFLAFVGLLTALFLLGLHAWRSSRGVLRLGIAACLAGIAGELAWGMLDVLLVTPPFFSFPVWGLVGLIMASDRISSGDLEASPQRITLSRFKNGRASMWGLVFLAGLMVLTPALASASYQAGFLAFQEQRWGDAVLYLEQAIRYNPLSPHFYEVLAKAYLEQQDIEQARSAYERANRLERGYSPYLSQLGWLAWLQGDVDGAVSYFEQAIKVDPGAVWRSGLQADLGLGYAAQARFADALAMFKQAIELQPQLAAEAYWQGVPRSQTGQAASFEVVLDPVYTQGPSPELSKRILSHLGVSDFTGRLFAYDTLATSPVTLNAVLDAIQVDYRQTRVVNPRAAPLLLAALAEASRVAGLNSRAEQAYLEFQSIQPGSAYGFRDLGVLYREQGRLPEAQATLERAVKISPHDFASRSNLALVYLDREMWTEAERMLEAIARQALVTPYSYQIFEPDLYTAQARLYQAEERSNLALSALRKAAIIRGAPADHLSLADLYRQLGKPQEATSQCLQAAEALMRTWPRPLDPQLQQIGECLTADVNLQVSSLKLGDGNSPDVIRQIMIGHIYRAQGQLDQALAAYQAAAAARPGEGGPHYFLGESYQALGQADLVKAEYRLAAQLDPLESLPLLALGKMQWAQGQRQSAIESFRAAVEITPGWGEAYVSLGNALLATGDQAGAAVHFQQAQWLDEGLREGLSFDFAAQLASARIESPGPDYVRNDYFTISGDRQRVLFTHPASRVSYTLTVPVKSTLAFDIALSPDSWTQPGDGVTFAVYVQSAQETQQVFSAYIDPKHNQADRGWRPYNIDLTAYAGQGATITFVTNCGPAGDCRYDWAGWGEPRLLEP